MGAPESGTPRCEDGWQGIESNSYLGVFGEALGTALLTQLCTSL